MCAAGHNDSKATVLRVKSLLIPAHEHSFKEFSRGLKKSCFVQGRIAALFPAILERGMGGEEMGEESCLPEKRAV